MIKISVCDDDEGQLTFSNSVLWDTMKSMKKRLKQTFIRVFKVF